MKIENAVALVTGANRGIGLAFANELLARGARKVYAGARDPAAITQRGVHPLRLDVNKPEEVAAAAALASDVTLVINNAGIAQPGEFLAADSEEAARRIFETSGVGCRTVVIATSGDRLQDAPLSEVGGKRLFVSLWAKSAVAVT